MSDIEVKIAEPGDLKEVGRLFGMHVRNQTEVGGTPNAVNQAFDPVAFVEATYKAGTSEYFVATKDGGIIGFARLLIVYGDGHVPWRTPEVSRTSISYLKRLPIIILLKTSSLLNRIRVWLSGFKLDAAHVFNPSLVGYVADVYVEKDFRRSGAGRALMEKALKVFEDAKVEYISLNVLNANEEGRAFWKSMGFADQTITMIKR